MTFRAEQPLSRAMAHTALNIYREFRGEQKYYARVFSEKRTAARKIKFWLQPWKDQEAMAKRFTNAGIPFDYASGGLAIYVPHDVTLSGR